MERHRRRRPADRQAADSAGAARVRAGRGLQLINSYLSSFNGQLKL